MYYVYLGADVNIECKSVCNTPPYTPLIDPKDPSIELPKKLET